MRLPSERSPGRCLPLPGAREPSRSRTCWPSGHGESTDLGRFEPGASPRDPLIWGAESDVAAAYGYLAGLDVIDPSRIGIVGASYSGEEAAEAGRMIGPAELYVLLSPGSLSSGTIAAMAGSPVPWLVVTSQDDPFLRDITASVREMAPSTEMITVPEPRMPRRCSATRD